jgi:hypothetical protein
MRACSMAVPAWEPLAVDAELHRCLAIPRDLPFVSFPRGTWADGMTCSKVGLRYLQNDVLVLTYLKNLKRYGPGTKPEEHVTQAALLAFARMSGPESYRLTADDNLGLMFASVPAGHHLRDGQEGRCRVCNIDVADTAELFSHLYGKRHARAFGQLTACPLCWQPIGASVDRHVFSVAHLEARYEALYDLDFVQAYND